jgi:hypothetical protein
MRKYGVWEPEAVKLQSVKTAIEVSSCPVGEEMNGEDYRKGLTNIGGVSAVAGRRYL